MKEGLYTYSKYPSEHSELRAYYAQIRKSQILLYFYNMTYLDTIIDTLKAAKPELTSKYYVNSIGIFGSAVRDDYSPGNSDIDIIVDFSQPIGIEFVDLAEYLEDKIKWKIDLVSKNGIKGKYFKEIEPEIIYV